MYTCVHTHAHIHTHTRTHTYIHTHTHTVGVSEETRCQKMQHTGSCPGEDKTFP